MNKQKVITILFLLMTYTYVKGQDRIITTQNDTINCKIISISLTHIQYEQNDDSQNITGKFIPIEQVVEYYREMLLITIDPIFDYALPKMRKPEELFPRLRIGLQGGGAYLLSSFTKSKADMQNMGVPKSQIDNYHNRLRNGLSTGADIHFFINRSFGVGLKYSLFASSVQMDLLVRDNNAYLPIHYNMGEKDNIYVNYVGPSVVFQNWLDKNRKFKLSERLSLGYTHYRQEVRFNPYEYIHYGFIANSGFNFLAEGNSFGGNVQVSFEYYPLQCLSVGANAGFLTTTFKTINFSNKDYSTENKLDKAEYINMSRLDYSIGIWFHF